jgi:hypothetical protein
MSQSMLSESDTTLDTRRRSLRHKPKEIHRCTAMDDTQIKLEDAQTKFCTEIHSLLQEAVEQANQGLAKSSEHCELCEVSACYTGPLHLGRSSCNPIGYELRGNGKKLGETLLVELTHDGMIEASLIPHPPVLKVPRRRIDLGWHPVPLRMFGATSASDLLAWYLAVVKIRYTIDQE